MSEEMIKEELTIKEEFHITYYFSILFTAVGTASILLVLSFKVESHSLFTILLSIAAGGIPVGVIGAYIDYKIAVYKMKNSKIV